MGNDNSGRVENLAQVGGDVHGGIHFHGGRDVPVPRELPPEPEHFVDREEQRAWLDRLLDGDRRGRAEVGAVTGLSGVGKSALIAYWLRAHDVIERFDHGQVYFDFGSGRRTVDQAAEHCLRALGVPGERIPPTSQGKIALLRTETDHRRLLFFFDNVDDVRELLRLRPASPDSVVLCTSHRDAAELRPDGVAAIRLAPLDEDTALDVLRRCAGAELVEAELDAAKRVVELCGYLPIALRVVAARLVKRGGRIERVAAELQDRQRRRVRLEKVLRALDFATDGLDEPHAELYRLLGVFPGRGFTAEAVAALADLDPADAEDALEELHDRSLLERDDLDRYRFHDLVREHAAEAGRQLGADRREAALRRLVGWYRRQGAFADRKVMEPTRLRVADPDVAGKNPFSGKKAALEWLERERPNLLAVVGVCAENDWHEDVVAICDGPLWALHHQHKHYADTLAALRRAVDSAAALGNPVAEARMRSLRSQLLVETGETAQARDESERACAVAERAGHRRVLASALEFRGKALHACGDHSDAIGFFHRAHALNEEVGQVRGMALQEYLAGKSLVALGKYAEALDNLRTALDRMAGFPDDARTPERIRITMGRAHQGRDRHDDALSEFEAAIRSIRARGASFDLAEPLELLAESLVATGRPGAQDCLREALSLHESVRSPKADRVRGKLTG
ncbi:NB-ARC domain-containing protein [Saccharopolyspora rosea]|uniref:NB-ARC domain-containing protein n=1 Tax=Saccharopolyspora rosea TaxID=524884 RepID=UPI0021D8875C|nr:NB-ARC domain-containing protein [Saccharopolyspora rosea]